VGRLSDVRARLECFPDIVKHLRTLREEMRYAAEGAPHATMVRLWCTYGAYAERHLPLSMAPILDRSMIPAGIAVGWHSTPVLNQERSHLHDHANRLLMGRLIHAAKQYDTTSWSTDTEDIQAIGNLAAYALASTRFGQQLDLIVGVPSSRGANALPYRVAKDLAFLTGIRYAPTDTITFGRQVSQIKQIRDYWLKRELLHGAMDARADIVRNRRVVLVDDVCYSGATLHESARACHSAGASLVTALVISKSFAFQHIPDAQRVVEHEWLEA
jgi:pyrimidine operon attenuation protein/uracil phosphoribosyltransferase